MIVQRQLDDETPKQKISNNSTVTDKSIKIVQTPEIKKEIPKPVVENKAEIIELEEIESIFINPSNFNINFTELDSLYDIFTFKEVNGNIPENQFYGYKLLSNANYMNLSQMFIDDYAANESFDNFDKYQPRIYSNKFINKYFRIYKYEKYYCLIAVNFEMLYNLKENKLSDIIIEDVSKFLGDSNLKNTKIITLNVTNINEYHIRIEKYS